MYELMWAILIQTATCGFRDTSSGLHHGAVLSPTYWPISLAYDILKNYFIYFFKWKYLCLCTPCLPFPCVMFSCRHHHTVWIWSIGTEPSITMCQGSTLPTELYLQLNVVFWARFHISRKCILEGLFYAYMYVFVWMYIQVHRCVCVCTHVYAV